MEKKVFLVTCVNEAREVVEIKPFDEYMYAFEYMKEAHERENDSNYYYDSIYRYAAYLINEDETRGYWWSIDEITIDL